MVLLHRFSVVITLCEAPHILARKVEAQNEERRGDHGHCEKDYSTRVDDHEVVRSITHRPDAHLMPILDVDRGANDDLKTPFNDESEIRVPV